eukprot:TRINITY_DN4745_c0_g1_i1.p1 TRINITY_DN4745_c0_g1~~TRINITY_DN4745_c0_g1_i1.p1  ORF type:complete len:143 (+),score=33.49 TRINITY_DN4745_c0_g1_i1:242-670(+)
MATQGGTISTPTSKRARTASSSTHTSSFEDATSPNSVPVLTTEERSKLQLDSIEKIICSLNLNIMDIRSNVQLVPNDKRLLQLNQAEEDLMQQLLSCDTCEVPGVDIRARRKEIIKTIQQQLSLLDLVKQEVTNEKRNSEDH